MVTSFYGHNGYTLKHNAGSCAGLPLTSLFYFLTLRFLSDAMLSTRQRAIAPRPRQLMAVTGLTGSQDL